MALMLREQSPAQSVFNAGITVDNLTWWFWIKAGIGFMFGATIFAAVATTLAWATMILGALLLLGIRH